MIVNLKFLNGNTKEIEVDAKTTIKEIKVKFLSLDDTNLDNVKIIYSGKILENDLSLENLALNEKSFFVVLTTSKSTLDSITSNQSEEDKESINGDLFDNQDSEKQEEEEEEEEEDLKEIIKLNNDKFLEMIKDNKFNILVDIIMNNPEYLTYALKFVQSGMIFDTTSINHESKDTNYQNEFDTIKNINIINDDEKIKQALEVSSGDMQMAIRYLFFEKHHVSS